MANKRNKSRKGKVSSKQRKTPKQEGSVQNEEILDETSDVHHSASDDHGLSREEAHVETIRARAKSQIRSDEGPIPSAPCPVRHRMAVTDEAIPPVLRYQPSHMGGAFGGAEQQGVESGNIVQGNIEPGNIVQGNIEPGNSEPPSLLPEPPSPCPEPPSLSSGPLSLAAQPTSLSPGPPSVSPAVVMTGTPPGFEGLHGTVARLNSPGGSPRSMRTTSRSPAQPSSELNGFPGTLSQRAPAELSRAESPPQLQQNDVLRSVQADPAAAAVPFDAGPLSNAAPPSGAIPQSDAAPLSHVVSPLEAAPGERHYSSVVDRGPVPQYSGQPPLPSGPRAQEDVPSSQNWLQSFSDGVLNSTPEPPVELMSFMPSPQPSPRSATQLQTTPWPEARTFECVRGEEVVGEDAIMIPDGAMPANTNHLPRVDHLPSLIPSTPAGQPLYHVVPQGAHTPDFNNPRARASTPSVLPPVSPSNAQMNRSPHGTSSPAAGRLPVETPAAGTPVATPAAGTPVATPAAGTPVAERPAPVGQLPSVRSVLAQSSPQRVSSQRVSPQGISTQRVPTPPRHSSPQTADQPQPSIATPLQAAQSCHVHTQDIAQQQQAAGSVPSVHSPQSRHLHQPENSPHDLEGVRDPECTDDLEGHRCHPEQPRSPSVSRDEAHRHLVSANSISPGSPGELMQLWVAREENLKRREREYREYCASLEKTVRRVQAELSAQAQEIRAAAKVISNSQFVKLFEELRRNPSLRSNPLTASTRGVQPPKEKSPSSSAGGCPSAGPSEFELSKWERYKDYLQERETRLQLREEQLIKLQRATKQQKEEVELLSAALERDLQYIEHKERFLQDAIETVEACIGKDVFRILIGHPEEPAIPGRGLSLGRHTPASVRPLPATTNWFPEDTEEVPGLPTPLHLADKMPVRKPSPPRGVLEWL
ncbi:hypothetical protein GNI_155830 [Gregarina niphandrodes]|uniref:Uncharacterized protein n=1 Tax=Gregarina niphandrodes TaxID=110365 RepID=A0A023AZL2_GRENI|nr:hypothetical protein GNI_155830 [Gregarina niphandrodes]EZG43941.1 hypothetical protein GNI_155830 [Gregarina niphandrodes]|eukprot:XP_011132912.1 hypothetical protein GNI_155830 [Gregarina niphandrodes]